MKKTGYDQFFKQAKKNAEQVTPVQNVPIDKLRQNLNKKSNKKTVRRFPVFQFSAFAVCGLVLFLAIENFDKIESFLQKIEIGLGSAQAETSVEKNSASTQASQEGETYGEAKTTDAVNSESTEVKTNVVNTNAQDVDYIYTLNERKKVLDQREEEIAKKNAELDKQKASIEQKLKELEEYREKISYMLKERVKTDEAKVDTLVQVYSNMKPSQAAKIFETMDEDLVIDILTKMKKKNAADILNLIKTEKAQLFAEKYAGYRGPASTESNLKDKEPETENTQTDQSTGSESKP